MIMCLALAEGRVRRFFSCSPQHVGSTTCGCHICPNCKSPMWLGGDRWKGDRLIRVWWWWRVVTALLDPPDRSTRERELKVFLETTHSLPIISTGGWVYSHTKCMEGWRQFPYTMLGSMTGSPCLYVKVSGRENRFGFTLGLQGWAT